MTHITRLQSQNYKKLLAVDIRPDQAVGLVPIIGKNAQGKSSVLDSIEAALGGKKYMPSRPVRVGEDEGVIRIELSNGLVVRRTFSEDGGGTLIVENGEGMRANSPQTVLDKLYSSVAFDPLAFTRLEPKDQLAQLRGMVKLDVDLDALAKADTEDYAERTIVNRTIKTLAAQLEGQPPIELESEELVDEAELVSLINAAAEHNGNLERRKAARETFGQQLQHDRAHLDGLREELAELQKTIGQWEENIAGREKQIAEAPALPEPINTEAVTGRLTGARAHNQQVEALRARRAEETRLQQAQETSEGLTKKMEERAKERLEAFEKANMPVPGLAFGDGEILFNGVPFEQASTAEQLRVSTAIGMAGNPDLKVMLVRDASLLDVEGYALLAEMASEAGFQFWVEAVDDGTKVGIVMEEGVVKGAETPEPIEVGKKRGPSKKQQEADAKAAHAAATAEPAADDAGGEADPKVEGQEAFEAAAATEPSAADLEVGEAVNRSASPPARPKRPAPPPVPSMFE